MKKTLLGATALAGGLALASAAQAQSLDPIKVSGFQYTYWAYVSEDLDSAPLSTKKRADTITTDTEIEFTVRG
ncbi:MAG: hypothetical protein RIC83_09100, partial [Alphaproteobacteria bacterium]